MNVADWEEVRLGDIVDYSKERVKTEELNFDNYISTENMLPNKEGKVRASSIPIGNVVKFKKGQTLVSNIRPYFKKIWKAEFDGGCSSDVLPFELKREVDFDFFYYYLSQDSFFEYVMAGSKGTKMPRGDKSQILKFPFSLPSLHEQKAIVKILSCLDDKIELNNRMNKTIEEMAQALFKNWFVDFEPFKDGEFMESEMGLIPKGWRVGKISDLGNVVGGSTPSKLKDEYFTAQGISWITPKDLSINKNKFIYKGSLDITELGLRNSSAKISPIGTVLFTSRAPIGYIAIAKKEVATNQGFKSIVPFENIGSEFVFCTLKYNLSEIENYATGSTFKELSSSIMKKIPTLIPNDKAISKFNSLCKYIFKEQQILEKQNKNLTAIRDTLLPKLMSGEIRVPFKEEA